MTVKNTAIAAGLGFICTLLCACSSGGSPSSSPPSPPPPPPQAYNPCPDQGNFPWQGPFYAQAVTFPSIPLGETPPLYDPSTLPPDFSGTILRPADIQTYPGPRPAVVLQHGHNGNQCNLWYMARALAGAGYVAIVYTQPYNVIPDTLGVDFDAVVSAIDFLGSAQNPFYRYTNPAVIGIVGFSEGSTAASYVPNLPEAYAVHAVAALDNLKHWIGGDAGAAGQGCEPPEQYPTTPLVPALGFAMDEVCPDNPQNDGADIKETGWNWWRDNQIPSVELVMRGYAHATFGDGTYGGSSEQLQTLAYFVEAWFDRWLNDDFDADQQVLACTVNGQNTSGLLSQAFLSGAYLTEANIDTSDYATYLTQNCR
ncbi:MAG: dienelactone hydrolase family protein [Gammaproteobacteria bacterium]